MAIDWLDWPLTPGTWTYEQRPGATIARFGAGEAVQAWVRCDLANHAVAVGRVARAGELTSMVSVRTTFGTVEWPARAVGRPVAGMEALRGASDPGLDQIAFSRGRFALMLRDQPNIIVPAWAEPARVVEDCRG